MTASFVAIEQLGKAFGTVRAIEQLTLHVRQGEMLVVVGPSGCGKTTCLRCLAGLERPNAGTITIGGRVVTAMDRGVFVPPERREIGMVFQSYAVWPHMTVFENVAYPLRAMGVRKAEITRQVEATLKLTRLEGLAQRYSSQISGGQQQRVALARSLVSRPLLLLFDEPLSNLDAQLRVQMREEIKELQRRLEFTAFYVTHDQVEAMAMADRIVVMQGGRIRQVGSPRDLYERPGDSFVAAFMGAANLLPGQIRSASADGALVEIEGGFAVTVAGQATPGHQVQVSIRPEAFHLRQGDASDDEWPGRIVAATYAGSAMLYRIEVGPHLVEVSMPPEAPLSPGCTVALSPATCVLIDGERRPAEEPLRC
ncbi:MAG: ABC transporter ATP-binding protein [Acetobacteraceae bacterium]|nr:ABC transporter ATP-binding protein [Acetobacteraceae bacterium]